MPEQDLLAGKRVLIVDDEPDVLDTLEELLPMCRVARASSFDEARHLLETESFDLAVLDIMGVAGFKLLEIANRSRIMAVMLTAHALSPENVLQSYRKGAASYIPKDEMRHIASLLNEILAAHGRGTNPWAGWIERLTAYWKRRFGYDLKDAKKEIGRRIDPSP